MWLTRVEKEGALVAADECGQGACLRPRAAAVDRGIQRRQGCTGIRRSSRLARISGAVIDDYRPRPEMLASPWGIQNVPDVVVVEQAQREDVAGGHEIDDRGVNGTRASATASSDVGRRAHRWRSGPRSPIAWAMGAPWSPRPMKPTARRCCSGLLPVATFQMGSRTRGTGTFRTSCPRHRCSASRPQPGPHQHW